MRDHRDLAIFAEISAFTGHPWRARYWRARARLARWVYDLR